MAQQPPKSSESRAMATPQRLQTINLKSCAARGDHVSFGQFPLLPTELRLRIWKFSIIKHRLVEIEVEAPESDLGSGHATPAPPLYSSTNALNKVISGRNYTATVQNGLHLHTKLLRVNRESREVALKFYRLHIPCRMRTSRSSSLRIGPKGQQATLYLNPEFDFVHLRHRGPVEHTTLDFMHDLKAYDPRGVGLVNLALDMNGMPFLHESLVGSYSRLRAELAAPCRASLVDTLSQLRNIIWMADSHFGRAIMGPLQDFRDAGVRFNHSMPVRSSTSSFDLLTRDPRPAAQVEPDLRYVLTACRDPRQMHVQWTELLEKWSVLPRHQINERVLFAYELPDYEAPIYDVDTADKFLAEEERSWIQGQTRRQFWVKKWAGRLPVESPEELEKASRPAIGFWLFPIKALGSLEGDIYSSKKMFDMTGHWPELALARLF
ncbi:hypothetical protein B0T25DRAFT_7734 [Lasiosphaeria hispida]|uniref:2EXR domain-containing protein n=1 Tax=Lasiosphaeria hispida TaxID=260671 RepID=A0AAJ0HTV4_9PEZI|nr:hypothetical protein B0T25DRAFT_7734 [Lasiosphaeria hispida]